MVALGGWGDNAGFSTGVASNDSITTYAKNIATMLDTMGFDGVGMLDPEII
jgi:chitinase